MDDNNVENLSAEEIAAANPIFQRRRAAIDGTTLARRNEREAGKFIPLEQSEEIAPLTLDDEVDDQVEEVKEEVEELPVKTEKHKIKVNGKELELTYEELVARASKVEAADEYLRRAKESADAAVAVHEPSTDVHDEVDLEDDLATVRAIQMGDEQEAVEALRKLRKQSRPSVNTDDVVKVVEERAKFQRAVEKFQSENQDLFEDERLKKLLIDEDSRLIANGDTRDFEERWEAIGSEIREWAGKPKLTPNQEKLERKLNAPSAPSGTTARNANKGVERAETPEERLERLRSNRRPRAK
jgi:hypothetical protein